MADVSSPFAIANSIKDTKVHVFNVHNLLPKQYAAWIINLVLAREIDCILHTNFVNQYWFLPPDVQYDYLFHSITKRKRSFKKWVKKDENLEEKLNILKEYYGWSDKEATYNLKFFNDDQLKELQERILTKKGVLK